MIARENVSGLGHEVHATEHDCFGFGVGFSGVCQLERIAQVVGVLNDFIALIKVAENHNALAECRFGCADALVQLLIRCGFVIIGQSSLSRRTDGDNVAERCARPVARCLRVELPRTFGQRRTAGFAFDCAGCDGLNLLVDRCCVCHDAAPRSRALGWVEVLRRVSGSGSVRSLLALYLKS